MEATFTFFASYGERTGEPTSNQKTKKEFQNFENNFLI